MMNDQKRENSTIRKDILETLDELVPGDVIEMWGGMEESYLDDIYEELRAELSRIETAGIDYERDWQGEDPGDYDQLVEWSFEEEESYEPVDSDGLDSSYHLFFLGLKGEQSRYKYEAESMDEEGKSVPIEGTGIIGCCVGISLLAPFALIVPESIINYEDSSQSYPDIEPHMFEDNDGPVDMEKYFCEMMGDEAVQSLKKLRNRITSILESFSISVLTADEAEKPVPWLKAAEEVFTVLTPDAMIKLKDAFFFRGVF